MEEQKIEAGKWYKHLDSTAYAKVMGIFTRQVRVIYDNGFIQLVDKATFNDHFVVTPASIKMNEKG